ncbi:hypothetical protein M422DRAFT_186254 [Sphaerobolus stellatus SS14]|uniref:MI domain-containing protein n=1 Tax=Sphaerobolus stellatus (strain SS14) TaxID=990650 RepID=A0A0C9V0Y1_SPHS4|nr:hypothetical protein M422DRAFT_186254 [Sphaerobolus stellatus SS14]
MAVCKDKPDSLPALDAIGLEPSDQQGSGSVRKTSRAMGPPPNIPGGRASIGGVFGSKPGASGSNFMGQFGAGVGGRLAGDNAGQMVRSASLGGPPSSVGFPRAPMVRTPSQGGNTPSQSSSLNPTNRTRSQRGGRRNDSKAGQAPQERDRVPSMMAGGPFEPVEPLKFSENRWTPMKKAAADPDSPEVVERKVKGLLNKLTMEKFDSISDQIIEWANRSEKEKDGRTLIQVIKLVFEKATDEAAWSEMYARLCRKMMEKISSNVQDEGIRSADGRPIAGGQLFRKYLLNRCQEDFERGWSMQEAAAKAAESKAADDKAVKEAAAKAGADGQAGEEVLYSEEYYAAQKAKRRGLGLVKFIGELFKLQMLTERIMHECIKKLLGNVENPEEEEIESLCKLLSTVGRQLDNEKARSHMDVYFQRMRELAKNLNNITSRMQFMLLDVLELRDRKWIPRTAQAAPTTIAAVHEQAAKDQAKAQIEKDQSVRAMGGREAMSRGGSRRGEQRGGQGQVGPDGWTSVTTPRPAGDLTQFGKISKGPLTFGPSSVFAAKSKDAAKGREGSVSRTASTSNMFAMLNSEAAAEPPAPGKSSRPPSRKPSADFTQTGITETPQRRKLNLLPRSKPVQDEGKVDEEGGSSSQAPSELPSEDEDEPSLTAEQAKAKINENVKEFWAIRDLDEAEHYFTGLPQAFRGGFIDKLVGTALERKEGDAALLGQLFGRAHEKGICKDDALEEGFLQNIEFIADIAIDVPAAYKLMAIMLKGSQLPKAKVEELAGKIAVEDEPVVHPKDRLLKEYETVEL